MSSILFLLCLERNYIQWTIQNTPMNTITTQYKKYFSNTSFIVSFVSSIAFLAVSIAINIYAIAYATGKASSSVTDIILSNIPAVDVDGIFVWGTLVVFLFSVGLLLRHIRKVPFALKTLALFILTRSFFVILTHVGPFPTETAKTSYDFLNRLLFGADSFFSGHTGMPFLGALVFWEETLIRTLYLLTSVFFAIVVLLGHLHYSIDVASAFFITYSIYHIAETFFKKDKIYFDGVL